MIKTRTEFLDMLQVGKQRKQLANVSLVQKLISSKIKNETKAWRRFKANNWKTDHRLYRDAEVEPAILIGKLGQNEEYYRTQAEECEILMGCLRSGKTTFFDYINLKIYHYFRFFHRVFLMNFISEFIADQRGNYLLSDVTIYSMNIGQVYRNPSSATQVLAMIAKDIEKSAVNIVNEKNEAKMRAMSERRQKIDKLAAEVEARKVTWKLQVLTARKNPREIETSVQIQDTKENCLVARKPRSTLLRKLGSAVKAGSSKAAPVYYLQDDYARAKISTMQARARSLKCSSRLLVSRGDPQVAVQPLSGSLEPNKIWRIRGQSCSELQRSYQDARQPTKLSKYAQSASNL